MRKTTWPRSPLGSNTRRNLHGRKGYTPPHLTLHGWGSFSQMPKDYRDGLRVMERFFSQSCQKMIGMRFRILLKML
jgi:hypothetical protein